jgi:2-polyprenyl-6-methoxyphenol hydroxylase-like FAD-dependent oxidoreductase
MASMQGQAENSVRRAVVLGASMAGLAAARVLVDHFDEVTIVERDALPTGAEGRKGVPQGRHLHGLLQRGQQVFEGMFPGLSDALIAGGGLRVDFSEELAWYHFGAWKQRFASGVKMIAMSRPFFEAEVRRRVLALPQVRCLDQHDVLGLRATPDGARITGVRVRSRVDGTSEQSLFGDLVVDATGRGSATPRWIEALGYPLPEEESVAVHVGYTTRTFRRDPSVAMPWKALYVIGDAPRRRIGAIFPIEGDRWIAILAGQLRDYPPTELPGFLEFAGSLPVDDLQRALASFEPLDDGVAYRFPSNLRRRYERMTRRPEGLVAVGDALCSFNPIYGQGMTTAALVAQELGACLRERRELAGLPGRFYRRAARVIDAPWQMTTLEDFRNPGVTGERPPAYPLIAGALARVHRATSRDREVALHFLRAMHMTEPPTMLLRPDCLARVLLRGGAIESAAPERPGALATADIIAGG